MYRVDRRKFEVGEIIIPPTVSYQEEGNLDEEGITIEEVLEATRPKDRIPIKRSDGLFVFRDLCDAVAFHSTMTDSNIYEVEVAPNTIVYHRGDMNHTELMIRLVSNKQSLLAIAGLYWNGIKTFKPCWEMLVNQMCIKSVLNTAGLRTQYQAYAGNFEAMLLYRTRLYEIYS